MGNYYEDYDNTYYGVCLNCGSAKCGYHGGCTDKDIGSDVPQEKSKR